MAQKENNVVTVIFPDGTKVYAEKVALLGINAGQNEPPQEGKHVAMMQGEFSLKEVVMMHQQMNHMMERAGEALIEAMEKQNGPGAVHDMAMDMAMDMVADLIVSKLVGSNPKLKEIMEMLAKK